MTTSIFAVDTVLINFYRQRYSKLVYLIFYTKSGLWLDPDNFF